MPDETGEQVEAGMEVADLPERSLDAGTAATLEIVVRRKVLVEDASAVYLVQQRTPPRPAWLRLTHGGALDASALERFIEEAPRLGGLAHDGLARVYEAGAIETPGRNGVTTRPYLMLECAPGTPVLDALERHHHDRAARIELLIAVCDAFGHAHRAKAAHGCLDHDRVLWREDAPPIVIDLGVALATGGTAPSTQAYRSPEVREGGDPITLAADVYALGVLGHAIISGHAPSERELLFEASRGKSDDLVQAVLDVATSPDPEARYADADRMVAALRHAAVAPTRSRTVSLAVTAVAMGVLGLGLGLAISGAKMRRRSEPAPVVADPGGERVAVGETGRGTDTGRGRGTGRGTGTGTGRGTDTDTGKDKDRGRDRDRDRDRDGDTVKGSDAREEAGTDGSVQTNTAAAVLAPVTPVVTEDPAVVARYELLLSDAVDRASEAEWMAGLFRASAAKAEAAAEAAQQAQRTSEMDAAKAQARTEAAEAVEVVLFEVMTELPPGASLERVLAGVEERMVDGRELAAISRLTLDELLGLSWAKAGRYEDAYPHLKSAHDAARDVFGAETPRTMRIAHALANAELAVGRGQEGEARLAEVLAWRRTHDGEHHPETLRTLMALAARRASRAPFIDAEPLYLELLAAFEASPETDRRASADAGRALALVYRRTGRLDDAEALLTDVIATWRDLRGRESREALAAEDDLAELYLESGRLIEAEVVFVRTMSIRQQKLGLQDVETLTAMHGLARVFEARERYQEAADLSRELLAAGGGLPETHWLLGTAKSLLGAALTREGRYEDAERLLLEGYGALREATGHPRGGVDAPRRRAAARLVALYEVWGRPESAARYRGAS